MIEFAFKPLHWRDDISELLVPHSIPICWKHRRPNQRNCHLGFEPQTSLVTEGLINHCLSNIPCVSASVNNLLSPAHYFLSIARLTASSFFYHFDVSFTFFALLNLFLEQFITWTSSVDPHTLKYEPFRDWMSIHRPLRLVWIHNCFLQPCIMTISLTFIVHAYFRIHPLLQDMRIIAYCKPLTDSVKFFN